MDVTPLVKQGSQIIQSYKGGSFRVSGVVYTGPVIIYPSYTTEWNYVKLKEEERAVLPSVSGLKEGDFKDLIEQADDIDVVLLGCGAKMAFLKPLLRNVLKDKGLSVDVMDTGAACRTYNVLLAEGRRVVAALLPFS